jgi:raffinose/stachyose/melibiose transport system permease protein
MAKSVLTAPAVTLFVLFYIVPVLGGLALSFFRWDGLQRPEYVGLENYRYLLSDPVFGTNVRVTLIVVGASLVGTLPPALLLAVCLSGRARLLPFFRAVLFLPVIFPIAAGALLWSEIYNPVNGFANEIVGVIGIGAVSWLGEESTALWSLIVVSIWSTLGLHMMIQLSALSAIPIELREAAQLETRSARRIFRHVVLPLLRESLTVSAALIVTGSFTVFTAIAFIMTRGGPVHSTEVLGLRAYLEGFGALEFGRASALTVVTMTMTVLFVALILALGGRRRVEY